MDQKEDEIDSPGPSPENGPKSVFKIATAVAFLVPWVTQLFGGTAWWSGTTVPTIAVWLGMGGWGVALVVAGGRRQRTGTSLIAGDVLGAFLFVVSFFLVAVLSYGGETGG